MSCRKQRRASETSDRQNLQPFYLQHFTWQWIPSTPLHPLSFLHVQFFDLRVEGLDLDDQ
ncbi:MAG: hypothetical protein NW224_08820 [Leptolyngbyaceae cyanobacterium bins.302]|nr:hypothetical protein [Leptolyngbyaceae cyanobacterium bins.302]